MIPSYRCGLDCDPLNHMALEYEADFLSWAVAMKTGDRAAASLNIMRRHALQRKTERHFIWSSLQHLISKLYNNVSVEVLLE